MVKKPGGNRAIFDITARQTKNGATWYPASTSAAQMCSQTVEDAIRHVERVPTHLRSLRPATDAAHDGMRRMWRRAGPRETERQLRAIGMWQHVPKSAREHAASRDLAHPDIDENTVDMVCAWQLAVQRMPAQWTPATTRERSAFCQCLLQQSGSCSYCNEDQTTRDIERAALHADAVQRAKEIAAPATAEQATKAEH